MHSLQLQSVELTQAVLFTAGDESLVTDFVPVSPARHLHPDTGHLVVRPDSAQSRPPQKKKAKDKKERVNMAEDTTEKSETGTLGFPAYFTQSHLLKQFLLA